MKKPEPKKYDDEWEELKKILNEEDLDKVIDRFEEGFEKEFGRALRQQT